MMLLKPHEPAPYRLQNEDLQAPAVLICDHAGRYIPEKLNQLGLNGEDLEKHIAYDIGSAQLTDFLSKDLNLPAIYCDYSRLVIDVNRKPGIADSIPEISDQVHIPGNKNLQEAEIHARQNEIFWPYHERVTQLIEQTEKHDPDCLLLFVHSFTPTLNGAPRPWEMGLLWVGVNQDVDQFAACQRDLHPDINLGLNEPYDGFGGCYFSLYEYTFVKKRRYLVIEVRQDLISSSDGVKKMGKILSSTLKEAFFRKT